MSSQQEQARTNELQPAWPLSVEGWQGLIGQWAKDKGWNDKERSFDEWTALFHTEISEAYEEYRNHHEPTEVYASDGENSIPKPEGIAIELADEVIRILHWFDAHGMSLTECLAVKMTYNMQRSHRHGGKRT